MASSVSPENRDIIVLPKYIDDIVPPEDIDTVMANATRQFNKWIRDNYPELEDIPDLGSEILAIFRRQLAKGKTISNALVTFTTVFNSFRDNTLPGLIEKLQRINIFLNDNFTKESFKFPCPNGPHTPIHEILVDLDQLTFIAGNHVIVIEDHNSTPPVQYMFKHNVLINAWLLERSYINPYTGEPISTDNSTLLPNFRLLRGVLGPYVPPPPTPPPTPRLHAPDITGVTSSLAAVAKPLPTPPTRPRSVAAAASSSTASLASNKLATGIHGGPRPPSDPRSVAAAASSSTASLASNKLATGIHGGPRPPSDPRLGAAAAPSSSGAATGVIRPLAAARSESSPGAAAAPSSSGAATGVIRPPAAVARSVSKPPSTSGPGAVTVVSNPLLAASRPPGGGAKGGRRRTRNYKKSKRSKTVRKRKQRSRR